MPEEAGSSVLTTIAQNSAAENFARRENMNTDALRVPRLTDDEVAVVKIHADYPETEGVLDTVLLEAVKFGQFRQIAHEEVDDSNVNVIAEFQNSFARSYAKKIDNAVFGTTAASNFATTGTVPFNSVYREVSQNAAANKIATAGPLTYAKVSQVLGVAENGGYWSDPDTIIVAHISLREQLRNLVDLNNRPLFIDQVSATQPATLFGYTLQFSEGAKTSAVATFKPTGNPLLIVGNKQHLILGVRSGPESKYIEEGSPQSDEAILRCRSRRGFAVGRASAFGVLEVTAGA